MKIVVSVQRQEDDGALKPITIQKEINRLSRRCVALMETWPHMEWMTQTAEVKPPPRSG